MNEILNIVLPVFCLIGLGYLAAVTGLLSRTTGDALAEFVFKIAVPILLMRSIASAQFSDANPWFFVVVYFSGIVVSWALAMLLMNLVFKRDARSSVISGVSASFSNLVLLGIPLIERAYGSEGLQILLFLVGIHLPIMMVISTFLMEYAVRADGVEKTPLNFAAIAQNQLKNLLLNPIIIGIFTGLVLRFTGIKITGLPEDVMSMLAGTTGPLALFALGMSLIKYGIKGNLFPAIVLSLLSLVVFPSVVYVLGSLVFSLPSLWLKVALLAASCPTGVNAYLFSMHFKVAQGLATNTIVLTLLGSIVSLPIWLSII